MPTRERDLTENARVGECLRREIELAQERNPRLTDREIERRSGMAHGKLSKLTRGQQDIRIGDLEAICVALDLPIGELYLALAGEMRQTPGPEDASGLTAPEVQAVRRLLKRWTQS
jgi:transcriptional regulator with XRE-family HTH domain